MNETEDYESHFKSIITNISRATIEREFQSNRIKEQYSYARELGFNVDHIRAIVDAKTSERRHEKLRVKTLLSNRTKE